MHVIRHSFPQRLSSRVPCKQASDSTPSLVQDLDASVLALSVQVSNMALGAAAERDEGEEAQSILAPSQLQVEVEAWREVSR